MENSKRWIRYISCCDRLDIYKVLSLSDPIYRELTVVHAFGGTLYLIQMIVERRLMSKPGIRNINYSDDPGRIWSGLEGAAVLLPGFAIILIAKPGNKTAAPSWPDPYIFFLVYVFRSIHCWEFCTTKQNDFLTNYLVKLKGILMISITFLWHLFSLVVIYPHAAMWCVNSSPPGQNGRHFSRQHFQMHFLEWKW